MQERDFLKDIIQKVATSTLKFESLNLNEISSSDTQKAIDLDEASK
jgi:hypothetical protein